MKITANTHANFSLPVVLSELIIIKIGNSHANPIIANIINKLRSEPSINHPSH